MTRKTYTARQSIIDRNGNIVAYELLFRDSEKNHFPMDVSDSQATSKLLVNTLLNMDIDEVTDGKYALINFPQSMLSSVVDLLPANKIAIEILETVNPDEDTYQALKSLYEKGYFFALDDFEYSPSWDRFFKFVKLIKVDIRATSLKNINILISKIQRYDIKLLAEKVESREEYILYRDLGFDYFQGYYFSTPEILYAMDTGISNNILENISSELLKHAPDYIRLKTLFSAEPRLTYKLFRLLKNITQERVGSILEGILILGKVRLRKLIYLLVEADLDPFDSQCLLEVSISRSNFCKVLALNSSHRNLKDDAFIVGLFSNIDIILKRDMDNIINTLPLSKIAVDALSSGQSNVISEFLDLAISFEDRDSKMVHILSDKLGVNPLMMEKYYDISVEMKTRRVLGQKTEETLINKRPLKDLYIKYG